MRPVASSTMRAPPSSQASAASRPSGESASALMPGVPRRSAVRAEASPTRQRTGARPKEPVASTPVSPQARMRFHMRVSRSDATSCQVSRAKTRRRLS
jgi:hypothetical protein